MIAINHSKGTRKCPNILGASLCRLLHYQGNIIGEGSLERSDPFSGGSRIFPRGGANSQSGCAYLLFLPKTAWKWKNLDPQGGRASLAPPLGSANAIAPALIHKIFNHPGDPLIKLCLVRTFQNFLFATSRCYEASNCTLCFFVCVSCNKLSAVSNSITLGRKYYWMIK